MKSAVLGATAFILLAGVSSCSGDQPSSNVATGARGGIGAMGGTPGSGGAGTAGSLVGTGGTPAAGAGVGGAATGGTEAAGGVAMGGAGGDATGGAPAAGAGAGGADGGRGGASAGRSGGEAAGAGGAAGSSGSSGAAGAGPRPTVTAAPGTTLVKVDTTVQHQTFEGWGTSLCWWANHVGGWSASARNAVVDAVVNPTTGLGYNIFRYNIGGGENPSHEHMNAHREIEGFQPSAGTWNWEADANQRAVLQQIVTTGSNLILEAFSNSPPYWMTNSGCAAGSADGSNNLKDDQYDEFADYLTEVVKHFEDTWGITFRTLEPLNEPNASWWRLNNNQEGCHFSPSNQETIIRLVAASLTAKGLTGTSVSASDENSMDDAHNNMRAFSQTTIDAISQMNVHSYAGSRRADVRSLATVLGKKLWQSESGPLGQTLADDVEAAFFMGARIIQDLRELKPEAWLDWQFGDPSRNWASVTLNDTQQTFAPLKRFYVNAGFSRYIRPGAVFVDVNDADMVAAVAADGKSLTLVVQNRDAMATKGFTFDLTKLPTVGAVADARRTSRTENLASLSAVAIDDYRFVAMIPPYSVTTFVVPMP
jgi:O-glycosyl hydrolase